MSKRTEELSGKINAYQQETGIEFKEGDAFGIDKDGSVVRFHKGQYIVGKGNWWCRKICTSTFLSKVFNVSKFKGGKWKRNIYIVKNNQLIKVPIKLFLHKASIFIQTKRT